MLRGATALVSASRDEGFGIPLVEAMALGTPLVVSDIPVFREVGGDAAAYVDPDDVPASSGPYGSSTTRCGTPLRGAGPRGATRRLGRTTAVGTRPPAAAAGSCSRMIVRGAAQRWRAFVHLGPIMGVDRREIT